MQRVEKSNTELARRSKNKANGFNIQRNKFIVALLKQLAGSTFKLQLKQLARSIFIIIISLI